MGFQSFGFTSDWITKWHKIIQPVTKHSSAKPKENASYFWHYSENCSIGKDLCLESLFQNAHNPLARLLNLLKGQEESSGQTNYFKWCKSTVTYKILFKFHFQTLTRGLTMFGEKIFCLDGSNNIWVCYKNLVSNSMLQFEFFENLAL